MTEEILKFTKLTFVIHFISGLIFTILFWIPAITGPLFITDYNAGVGAVTMMLGAAFVGLTIGSLLGILAKEWKEIRIVVLIEAFWLVASLISTTINLSAYEPLIYVSLAITIILLALFALAFLQQEDKIKPLF
ncbi:hypothetical protein LCGC14_0793900 [marine sediment metagenome]|uniref:Major facilitator superfamily (MFS) profile domain-containing protein n=1 Tax=marine sediment metagenome TaxID=412755 RepID=A0A0F9PW18_9ZZZZ|nr:MAG: hypothetical protein Lokiarch_24420 [Candidatus Lokiarchaeum sp. GC14_75]HEC40264.1 hypothetical protein [bacterium]